MLETVAALDVSLSHYLNSFVGGSPSADLLLSIVESNQLFKGAFIMLLFWGLWFWRRGQPNLPREKLLSTLVVAILTVAVIRVLAAVLPPRLRPMHAEELGFELGPGNAREVLDGFGSMPSDHAGLFFAMATGLYLANRIIGLIALAHAALIICLPRVYFGLHFVSDVVVGGLIGSVMVLLIAPSLTRRLARTHTVMWSESHPHLFYPALIFVTWQLAQLFDPLRQLAEGLLDILAR